MSWREQAACASPDVDPEIFYPHTGGDHGRAAPAKAVCAACTVISECLAFAHEMEGAYRHGVWGGLTAEERHTQRRRNNVVRGHRDYSNAARCGTESGARRRRRKGEYVCEECRKASRLAFQERQARRREQLAVSA